MTAGYRSSNKLNTNFNSLKTAIENTLSRDGTAPNQMGAVLDMNNNRVINAGAPIDDNDLVRKVDIAGLTGGGGDGTTDSVARASAAAAQAVADTALTTAQARATTTGSNINTTDFKTVLAITNVNNTSDVNKPVSTATTAAISALEGTVNTALALKIPLTQRGAANGVATLDGSGLVPSAQLPVSGSYKGSWNATTNSPTIVSGTGINGDFYLVGTAGATTIDGISSWAVGDQIRFNGTAWQKIASTATVSSVAGKTGAVALVKADVGLSSVDDTSDAAKPISTATQTALDGKLTTTGGNAGATILTNLPFVSPLANSVSRPAADKFADVLCVQDFSDVGMAGIKFNYAATAAGILDAGLDTTTDAIFVPPGNYVRDTNITGGYTWLLTGETNFTGTYTNLPGQIIQLSGVKRPDGGVPSANPMYVGLGSRSFVTSYESLTGRISPLDTASLCVFSPYGFNGVFGGSRSSDNTNSGYDEGGIGGFFYCDNDRTSPKKGLYGIYVDAVRRAGAGVTHGAEIDAINMGSVVPVTPNSSLAGPPDFSTGLWIAAGGGVAGAQTATAAMTVLDNGAKFDKGIVFRGESIVDRGSGRREAIAFGYGHYLTQYGSVEGSGVVSKISFESTSGATGTDLLFDNNGASFTDLTTRANRLNVNNSGFTFGPSGVEWMKYSGGVFTVGATADPLIYASAAGTVFPKETYVARSGAGAYSLRVTPVASAVSSVLVSGSITGGEPSLGVDSTDARVPLMVRGKAAGFKVDTATMVFATDNASAAAAGCEIGEIYINTAVSGALMPRTA